MKLYRVINQDGFKTYDINKVEKVEHNGKTYIASRFVDYSKTNVLTLKKQAIVDKLIKEGMNISEISKIIGVSEGTINSYWLMKFKIENYSNAQSYPRKANGCCKKVKVVCYTDNSIVTYDSVTAAAESIGCSCSNVSNYCRSNKVYKHKSTGKEYKMSFVEE